MLKLAIMRELLDHFANYSRVVQCQIHLCYKMQFALHVRGCSLDIHLSDIPQQLAHHLRGMPAFILVQ